MNCEPDIQVSRRSLFAGRLFEIGYVVGRAGTTACSEIDYPLVNTLVLPTAGLFAMHHGPRRQVVATPNHAVFISAGEPYRVSFPGCIGDEGLSLRFSGADLAQVLPEAVSGDSLDTAGYSSHALLSPELMLARSLLCRRLVHGDEDPLAVEELGVGLLVSSLCLARKAHAANRPDASGATGRKFRQVERVKEAISLAPERKWTLADLAGIACVSPHHLAHVFSKEVGTSVYHYVLRLRLGKALGLVLDSDVDLTAVALETGFASHSHFTARFRALFGLTPNDLRRGASAGKAAHLRKIVTARPFAGA